MNGKNMAFTLSAAAAAFFTTIGCSAQPENAEAKVSAEPGRILVAFYSWSGNTKFAAEKIAGATGGTLFEIQPEKAYPADYSACTSQAKKEIREGFRPALTSKIDLKNYDVIFIGSPNWWGTMAPPVASFLASADLKGKTLIPFFTHGGGGMQNCEKDTAKLGAAAKVMKAAAFSGSSVKRDAKKIEEWAQSKVEIKK